MIRISILRKALAATLFLVMFLTSAQAGRSVPPNAKPLKHRFFEEPRKIFWKGEITLKVPSFEETRVRAVQLAEKYEGEPYNQETRVAHNGRKFGQILVRIPEKDLGAFLKEARQLGVVHSEKISAPDLTEEFVDLGRRLRNLTAEEDQLRQILRQATHVLEVLQVQQHLFNVRVEIERITSRRGEIALKSQNALFTLSLFEPGTSVYPVYPGGAREFFPRWWRYAALPTIKAHAKTTYYKLSEDALSFVLGTRKMIPNALILLAFVLVLGIFLKRIWPAYRTTLEDLLGYVKENGNAFSGMAWTLALLYFLSLLVSPQIVVTVFLAFLCLAWLRFTKSPAGQRFLERLEARKVARGMVHAVLALLPISSLLNTFFPDLLRSFQSVLTSVLEILLAACLAMLPILLFPYLKKRIGWKAESL